MLKRVAAVATGLALVAGTAGAAEWEIDKAHSSVQFKVSHMVITKVTGRFGDVSGKLTFDGKDLAGGTVEMQVAVGSINTDNENRDNHLKSDDFFNAETYPYITFKSKKVIPGDGNKFKLVGDLTIRDVTREVTFDCEFYGLAETGQGTKSGFEATTRINRQDFGVKWSKTLDNGGLVAGNDVDIVVELEFNKVS